MSIARQLFQLQEFDLALESNERDQARAQSQLCDSPEVIKARANALAEQKRIEELAKLQKSAEWEIDDLSTKIVNIDKKLYGGKITNSKELSSYQTESVGFKEKCSAMEDKALLLMDEVDAARKSLTTLKEQLTRLETQWQAQQKQLAAELEQLRTGHTTLEEQRKAHLAQVSAAAAGTYQDLRKRKGVAVARIEQGTCRGCRIALPSSDLQAAKGGGMVKCSSCGRIVYLP